MKFRCTITGINKGEKEILYSFEYEIPGIPEKPCNNAKYIPTVIDKTISEILNTPIPEQLDKYKAEDLSFTAQGMGIDVTFDLKGRLDI